MRSKSIFPPAVLEQSAEQIFREKSKLSSVIYLTVVIAVICALIAINFIYVDVNIQATGIIKPKEDHTVVVATTNGYAHLYNFSSNAHVCKGDTLLVIDSELIAHQLPLLEKRQEELSAIISDLNNITTRNPALVLLQSPMYRQDVLYYVSEHNEVEAKMLQSKSAYERSKKMLESNLIPMSDFEPIELEYTQSRNAVQKLENMQKRQWQADLIGYESEMMDITSRINQIKINETETVICSPVTGTLHNIQTLFDNTYVTAGQQLVEISPDGQLILECYVQPKDIGYIKPGMKGRIKVTSLNYNDWGVLEATVTDVFDDITVSSDGNSSFYKIYCTLSSDHLTLKNGYKGYIRKGMTVYGNFTITQRTIFQLLYDDIDNWLNPNTVLQNEQ